MVNREEFLIPMRTSAVIAKKREPFLGRITPALDAPQIARDGPLG
jgi:hypothetical protein